MATKLVGFSTRDSIVWSGNIVGEVEGLAERLASRFDMIENYKEITGSQGQYLVFSLISPAKGMNRKSISLYKSGKITWRSIPLAEMREAVEVAAEPPKPAKAAKKPRKTAAAAE